MSATANINQNHRNFKAALLIVIAALLVFYVLAPQIKYFHNSLATVKTADFALVGLAWLFIAASYLCAAATYCFIAYFNLNYWRTALIQVADSFTNKLLPAGAGGLATNVIYLNRQHKGRVKAGFLVALNNLIGVLGHIGLLLALLVANGLFGGRAFTIKLPQSWQLALVAAAIVTPLILYLRRYLPRLAAKNLKIIVGLLGFVLGHPKRMAAAFTSSLSLTVCYTFALYFVLLALNIHISFLQTFLVLTVGAVAIAVTPTPGGIGGVEAGIVASLISFGISPQQALSAALVYRVVTYWLPLLPGLIAFRLALKKGYLRI